MWLINPLDIPLGMGSIALLKSGMILGKILGLQSYLVPDIWMF